LSCIFFYPSGCKHHVRVAVLTFNFDLKSTLKSGQMYSGICSSSIDVEVWSNLGLKKVKLSREISLISTIEVTSKLDQWGGNINSPNFNRISTLKSGRILVEYLQVTNKISTIYRCRNWIDEDVTWIDHFLTRFPRHGRIPIKKSVKLSDKISTSISGRNFVANKTTIISTTNRRRNLVDFVINQKLRSFRPSIWFTGRNLGQLKSRI